MSTSSNARVLLAAALTLAALAGCSLTTEGELQTFRGEWCTLRGLAASGYPPTADRYVGMVIVQDGESLLGSGSSKRRGSDVIYSASFRGSSSAGQATVSVTGVDPVTQAQGPEFTMTLSLSGPRDLVGTISGDPGLAGPITLVRLGPRCFFE